jgi:hypothetical protein
MITAGMRAQELLSLFACERSCASWLRITCHGGGRTEEKRRLGVALTDFSLHTQHYGQSSHEPMRFCWITRRSVLGNFEVVEKTNASLDVRHQVQRILFFHKSRS